MRYAIGDRVRVADSYHGAHGELGIVTDLANGLERRKRLRRILGRQRRHYWVTFDSVRPDTDSDEQYSAAFWGDDLLLVERPAAGQPPDAPRA